MTPVQQEILAVPDGRLFRVRYEQDGDVYWQVRKRVSTPARRPATLVAISWYSENLHHPVWRSGESPHPLAELWSEEDLAEDSPPPVITIELLPPEAEAQLHMLCAHGQAVKAVRGF